MDVLALQIHGRLGGVEGLVTELADFLAVHGVGKVATEPLDVEKGRALADLLVGRKGDADLAVGDFGVRHQIFDRRHNLRHARLVVRTEQGSAVGDDDLLPHVIFQDGELLLLDRLAVSERHVAPCVDERTGFYVLARAYGLGIEVGDKPKRGRAFPVGGDRGIDVAMLVHKGVDNAELVQLLYENLGKIKLFFRAGVGTAFGVGLRIHANVFQKAFFYGHNRAPFHCIFYR